MFMPFARQVRAEIPEIPRTCATDSRFDMSKAMVIFGHKAEFYKDVCRAYGF
jgi:hypothetical protein